MESKKGSALLLTTILLFVIVSMVVSLSSFTIMEQKMSQKTKSSTRAFYNSESGIEWALNKIATSSSSDINTTFSVTNPGNGIDCPAVLGGADNCKIYLLSSEGKVITNGSLAPSEIKAVRSVGTQDNETQRAIEAAVAGTGGGCYVDYSLPSDSAVGSVCNVNGFTNKGSAGNWGSCIYRSGDASLSYLRPPGGHCSIGGWAESDDQGEAFVCCQN